MPSDLSTLTIDGLLREYEYAGNERFRWERREQELRAEILRRLREAAFAKGDVTDE